MPLILPDGSQLRNRYQVIKLLDASPLRNIYLVQDLHLRGNTWVLKQILPVTTGASTGTMRKRFDEEARALSTLEHPCIPRLLDYFFQDRCFFVIRQYIPGTDLATLLSFQGGSLNESDALRLLLPVAELFGFLVRKNVGTAIFRDLSLGSLIVTPEGELRLIDFGFTRLFGKANTLGPVDYSAPEQFSGEGTDSRTLVYNLGAMLYHLLTGFNPGDSPFNLEPVETWAPHTSPTTCRLVSKAIAHEPADRFASPAELVKHLRKARTTLDKRGAGPKSGTQPLSSPVSAGAMLAAALTLFFLAAGSYALYEMIMRGGG